MRYVSGHNATEIRRPVLDERYYTVEDRGYTTPCWIWGKTLDRKGYGRVWHPLERRIVMAHRRMYEQEVGLIPEDHQIDHLCRVRACVRADHLEAVTQETNQRRGANAKLTDADRAEALRLYAEGATVAAMARHFGLSWPTMNAAVH